MRQAARPSLAAALACGMLMSTTPALASDFFVLAPFSSLPPGPVDTRTLDGAPLTIAAEQDRPVLLHFFASWCEPCVDELPALAAFALAQGDRVRLIAINVAEPASRVRKFVERFGLPGMVALDPDKSVAAAYAIRGLPATVVIALGGGRALAATGPLDWTAPSTAEAIASLTR